MPKMLATVKALHEAMFRFCWYRRPSDNVVPGVSVHDEMVLKVNAGLTPDEALAPATVDAAKYLGLENVGEIKEGASADLLIFSENPAKTLDNLDTLDEVIAAGRTYTARKLTLHQRKQIKASRTGLYQYINDLLPHISGFL